MLREIFDYPYEEIAAIVGKGEAHCRQLAARARRHVAARRRRFESTNEQRAELARRFFAACERGDTDGLVQLAAEDAVAYFDGGGRAPAPPEPVVGRPAVARVLLGLAAKTERFGLMMRPAEINGAPGALIVNAGGNLVAVLALELAGEVIRAVYTIWNLDKLRHLARQDLSV